MTPSSQTDPDQPLADLLPLQEDLPADHRSGFVAVVGRPNVGKSTLVNGWLGQKIAIVSPKPQTTRHRQLAIITRPDAQIILLDTPGLHKPHNLLGEYMMDQATQAVPDADVICLLVDGSTRPTDADRLAVQDLQEKATGVPVLLVINKIDLVQPGDLEARIDAYRQLAPFSVDWVALSALEAAGRDDLLERVAALLPRGPRYYPADQITDQQERFIAAEMIREQVLLHTYQEVPHSVAVLVSEFKERSASLTYVGATIYVERDTQKRILLGKGGQLIKEIGKGARAEIEEMIGNKVYLDLWVKVWPNWRKDEQRLRWLGFALPPSSKNK
ncbi:MAG: GTPase Era [Caldilineales bacterium]